jgi:hypothetical protein
MAVAEATVVAVTVAGTASTSRANVVEAAEGRPDRAAPSFVPPVCDDRLQEEPGSPTLLPVAPRLKAGAAGYTVWT